MFWRTSLCYGVLFYVLAYFCMFRRTFLCFGLLVEVMVYLLMSCRICDVMAYFLTSQRTS